MLRIFAVSKDLNIINADSLADLDLSKILWYWADFSNPDERETKLLDSFFHFHQLSVEDAVYSLNRPKLDYYEEYDFIIVNALNQETLDPEEIALFVGKDYIVSYHKQVLSEIDEAWLKVTKNKKVLDLSPAYIAHLIIDKIVDQFFPAVNRIEDYLSDLDNTSQQSIHELINEVFKIRGELLKLRRLVNSMRDLLYRMINSDRLENFQRNKMYFADIHDHLLKLSEMIEASRK
jgi:magnesium transporter